MKKLLSSLFILSLLLAACGGSSEPEPILEIGADSNEVEEEMMMEEHDDDHDDDDHEELMEEEVMEEKEEAPVVKEEPAVVKSTVSYSAFEFGYSASTTTVKAGEVTLVLTNNGKGRHDLALEGLGAGTSIIGPGESESFTVTLKPGTYTYYCTVPGHRTQGMEGTLIVE